MSEWKRIAAESFCDSVRDGTHDTPKQVDCGYKLVTAKHINNGQIDLSEAYLISESDYQKINERSKVEKWDVLMSMIGNGLGKSAVVKDNPQYAIKNLALFKIGDEVKAKWLHYYLSSQAGQGFIYNSLQGSGQPFISLSLLRKFPIPVPDDEKTMQVIVGILSRYDSLIENYQKQIKLLEEAAQRLYKEWFVDLRFPGHEHTKIINGLPDGWIASNLGQLAEFKRGKTITKKEIIDGTIPVVAGGLGPAYYCNKSNTTDRVITVSGSGANAGFTRMYFENVWASDCSFADKATTPFLHFVYCYLKDNNTTIVNMQKGSAQPHVYAKDINALPLNIPTDIILNTFEKRASLYYNSVSALTKQIRFLAEARDRLLPKLMSGEIEVSGDGLKGQQSVSPMATPWVRK